MPFDCSSSCSLLFYHFWYQINTTRKHIHSIVHYENFLICMFMIINEAFSNQKEIIRKLRTCISTVYYPRVQSLVPNQCSDQGPSIESIIESPCSYVAILSMVRHDDYLFCIFMNDNENIRTVRKSTEN